MSKKWDFGANPMSKKWDFKMALIMFMFYDGCV